MNMNNLTSFLDKNLGGKFSGYVSKVKGMMNNYTEFQMKVEEATNNEKWGASSTLMQEIAQGTYNIEHFHEIMDIIYKKMQERDVNWRQCYKSLQLLEYLIKNGSEKVIDNARDHVYELKALEKFMYKDDKGKDQGINIQVRAKEIIALLNSQEKIEEERRKARENRGKYAGFSSDNYREGSYNSSSYNSNGNSSSHGNTSSFSSSSSSTTNNTSNSRNQGSISHSSTSSATTAASTTITSSSGNAFVASKPISTTQNVPSAVVPATNFGDLIDMSAPVPAPASNNAAATSSLDDDWGDFASSTAVPQEKPFTATSIPVNPQPASNPGNLIDLL